MNNHLNRRCLKNGVRFLALYLALCFSLPKFSFALREMGADSEPIRTGLEEALRPKSTFSKSFSAGMEESVDEQAAKVEQNIRQGKELKQEAVVPLLREYYREIIYPIGKSAFTTLLDVASSKYPNGKDLWDTVQFSPF